MNIGLITTRINLLKINDPVDAWMAFYASINERPHGRLRTIDFHWLLSMLLVATSVYAGADCAVARKLYAVDSSQASRYSLITAVDLKVSTD
jgi:hypothetical protein